MYMDFYDLIIRHKYNGITHGSQEGAVFMLLLLGQGILQYNDKLGTVSETDLLLRLGGNLHNPGRRRSPLDGIVNLFAQERILRAL